MPAFTFCPTCANLLQVQGQNSENIYACEICPYLYVIDKPFTKSVALKKKKEVEDVLGGARTWENVARTQANCPNCGHKEAYFKEVQTRSADEPATLFYRCCNEECNHTWKEN